MYIQNRGYNTMAKPIEWGLTLEGQDARDFEKYLENPEPTFTPEGRKLMKEALLELEAGQKELFAVSF